MLFTTGGAYLSKTCCTFEGAGADDIEFVFGLSRGFSCDLLTALLYASTRELIEVSWLLRVPSRLFHPSTAAWLDVSSVFPSFSSWAYFALRSAVEDERLSDSF